MKTAIITLTRGGLELARRIGPLLGATLLSAEPNLKTVVKDNWNRFEGFIFIMASGIVVRTIADLLINKRTDPAIVVMDEKGRFAISLLSGHLGGANDLARRVGEAIGATAVITTASDTLNHTAIDLWAANSGLRLERGNLTKLSSRLVNTGEIMVYCEPEDLELPADFRRTDTPAQAQAIISNRLADWPDEAVLFRPPNLVAGIGCNRGTDAAAICQALESTCNRHRLAPLSVGVIASITIKQNEEGLIACAAQKNIPLVFFDKDELNAVPGISRSNTVYQATGAYAVAEPAAMLGAESQSLLVRKEKCKDVTIAIATRKYQLRAAC